MPRRSHDVYAAIDVEGRNEIEVNFGSSLFAWKESHDWAWHVQGRVGQKAEMTPQMMRRCYFVLKLVVGESFPVPSSSDTSLLLRDPN